MIKLSKIKDVSNKYNITARTLRFYEDMGLIESSRMADYAYRVYDEEAMKRLEQILILRKLNIPIRDIQRIFSAPDSTVVLDVLNQKADDIDSEVALLHELKEIVLDFVRQIEQADFNSDEQVKLLYDKAKEIEIQLISPDYIGNPGSTKASDSKSIDEVIEKIEKLDDKRLTTPIPIKVYRQSMPAMRFIGKKFTDGGTAWGWGGCGITQMELLKDKLQINLFDLYEDGDSIIGLMSHRAGFEYWLGYFVPHNTPVPEGYGYEDFPAMDIVTCWLYGKSDEVFAVEPIAYEKLGREGFAPIGDAWFERYHPMRTQEDKQGYQIIDICFFATDLPYAERPAIMKTDFPAPPSVSQFEVYGGGEENLARGENARPIAINSLGNRLENLTSGNFDPMDDTTRWTCEMKELENAEPNWGETKNIWFGVDLGKVMTVERVTIIETGEVGYAPDRRRVIGEWVVEVATDISDPNNNCTLSSDGWTVVAGGCEIGMGESKEISFNPVQARYVRMRTLSTLPQVWGR